MPKPVRRKQYTAVGCHIFAGGFTLGVMKHFKVLCHLEETGYGVKTFRHNVPSIPVHVGIDSWPLDELSGKVDFVYGNPPCAAWSPAGYSKSRGKDKWLTDPRVACTSRHFQLLDLHPKVWAWESVIQAIVKGKPFVDNLTREAIQQGYSVSYLLHDAQYLGLPQVRKRFFMVCHQFQFNPCIPDFDTMTIPIEVLDSAIIGEPCSGKSFTPYRQFSTEMLAKIPAGWRLTKFWTKFIASANPDDWERNPNGTVKGRPSFGHSRLPVDRPGGAVVGYGFVHPTEPRWLSTEEMQVLSGFPPEYLFTPKSAPARASEIARGVCPPVGEWLAKSVIQSLKERVKVKQPSVTLFDFRKPNISPVDLTREYT